jgi:Tol biopolymer transport system component
VEPLEDRCVPSTLQAISVADPHQPPSDTAAGISTASAVSSDGVYVAFQSTAPNLVPGQTGGSLRNNVFLLNRSTGAMTLVSHVPDSATTTPAHSISFDPMISRDGRYIAYSTDYPEEVVDGVPVDPVSHLEQTILYDRVTGKNTLVSHLFNAPLSHAGLGGAVAMSGNGRYIVFSAVGGVVQNEAATGAANQLYLYDQVAGTTVLVTHAFGQPATPSDQGFSDANSILDKGSASVADDGTVAFTSSSTNLGSTPTSAVNVYLYTPANQANQRITIDSSPGVYLVPILSGDGSAVAYASTGAQVSGQVPDGHFNVFRYDRHAGTTKLVSQAVGSSTSVGGNGDSGHIALSHDGRFLAFDSDATNLLAGQSGAAGNAFLYNAAGSALTLLSGANNSSQVGSGGTPAVTPFPDRYVALDLRSYPQGDFFDSFVTISDDGSLVAYASQAGNIVPGQAGPAGVYNIFLYSRTTGQNALVSGVGGSATTAGSFNSGLPALSGSGNLLTFTTRSPDLSSGVVDGNGAADVLAYTPGTPGTTLVSRSAFVPSKHGGDSFAASVSADGRYTVFTSTATNLVADQSTLNEGSNIFLFDKVSQTTTLVNHIPGFDNTTGDGGGLPGGTDDSSPPRHSQQPAISADGNYVAFVSPDTNLVPGEQPDTTKFYVYLYDRRADQIRLVNHAPGMPGIPDAPGALSFSFGWDPVISTDGRYVAYAYGSPATGVAFVAVYDSVLDTTTRFGITMPPLDSEFPESYLGISDNGQFLTARDSGNVYLFDRTSGSKTLVSHAFGSATTAANGTSSQPVLSHDGSAVAFVSQATNLVAGQVPSSFSNVFLYDVGSGAVRLVSGVGGSATVGGGGNSDRPAIGLDGSYVAYRSDAPNLVPGQGGPAGNIFEFNASAGTQTLVSHQAGAPTTAAGGASQPVIDDDGHLVTYLSTAGNLIPGQSGPAAVKNVFIWLRTTGANILASGQNGSPTVGGNADSDGPLLTRHSFPGFSSKATDLNPGLGGTSVAYINTLVKLSLSPNTVADGTGAGVLVGAWTVSSLLPQQYQLVGYNLPGGEADNAVFSAGNGTLSTGGGFLANYAGRNSYQVNLHIDIGFGDSPGLLTVLVAAPVPPPLTVTVTPKAGQEDPSSGPAIDFTVVFSAPPTDFTAAAVALGGSAGPGQVDILGGSGTTFTIAVSRLSQAGTVTANIPAGRVHDGNGTANQTAPAAASVTYSPSAPPAKLLDAANAFARSREHYTQFVTGEYRQFLKREPDPVGLQAWVDGMLAGLYSDERVEASFLNSVEYVTAHNGIGRDWLLGMYHDLLGRTTVGDDEVNGWLGVLAGGTAATDVAYGFASSQERETERVLFNYKTYLGRPNPGADEVAGWVNAFLSGLTNESMVAGFVGSPEYWKNPQKGQSDAATWVGQAYRDVLFRSASPGEIDIWVQFLQTP